MSDKTAEQQARDMLERMGIENAQLFTSGDLVELANLIDQNNEWKSIVRRIIEGDAKYLREVAKAFYDSARQRTDSLKLLDTMF